MQLGNCMECSGVPYPEISRKFKTKLFHATRGNTRKHPLPIGSRICLHESGGDHHWRLPPPSPFASSLLAFYKSTFLALAKAPFGSLQTERIARMTLNTLRVFGLLHCFLSIDITNIFKTFEQPLYSPLCSIESVTPLSESMRIYMNILTS